MISSLAYQYIPMTESHHYIRTLPISAVVIHYTASIVREARDTVNYWASSNPYTSSNYIIDVYGRITAVIPEEQRPYTSSSWGLGSRDIDNRAITIECSCNYIPPDINRSDLYTVSQETLDALVELLADIGKRYEVWGDPDNHHVWVFTGTEFGNIHAHKWYSATPCPGEYLYSRFNEIAKLANKRMKEEDSMTEEEKKQLDETSELVDKHTKPKYNSVEELPSWYKSEIKWLVDNGYLKGTDKGLDLSLDMVRLLTIVSRMMQGITGGK